MPEIKLISVAVIGKPAEIVKAEIYGPLAIHESINDKGGVTVTHIKLSRAVLKNVTHEVALKFIKDTEKIDWSDVKANRYQIELAIAKAKA